MNKLMITDPIEALISMVRGSDDPWVAKQSNVLKGRVAKAIAVKSEKHGWKTVGEFADQFQDFNCGCGVGPVMYRLVRGILIRNDIRYQTPAEWRVILRRQQKLECRAREARARRIMQLPIGDLS